MALDYSEPEGRMRRGGVRDAGRAELAGLDRRRVLGSLLGAMCLDSVEPNLHTLAILHRWTDGELDDGAGLVLRMLARLACAPGTLAAGRHSSACSATSTWSRPSVRGLAVITRARRDDGGSLVIDQFG